MNVFCIFQLAFWDTIQSGIKVVFERVRAMNMLLLRSVGLLFLLGSGAVLGIGNAVATWAYVIRHNDIALNNERKSGPLNGDAARQWYRATRRVNADAEHVKAHGTAAPFWRTIRTLINNINATSTRLKTMESRITRSTAYEQGDSSIGIESETERSPPTNRHEVSSTLRDGKLDSSKPASLVPPSRIGRRDGNKRLKRSAARSQERTHVHGRKKREMSGQLDPLAGQAIPRPLTAYNQTTDFPFNPTTYYDFFTFPDDDKWETTTKTPLNTIENTNKPTNPFYPITQESLGAYAVAGVAVIVFAVGVFGNIAIMCIVCHNYYMRSISNSLLANLALWDFFLLVFCLPLVVYQELTKDWLLGELSCKAVPYVEVVSLGVVTFTLCALCVDRFRAASNVQMHYETVENCSSTAAKLAVIWIGALLLALPELVIHQLVMAEEDGGGDRCVVRISPDLPDPAYVLGLTYQGARLWWHFGCYFCLPMFFTVVGSLATARKIRRAEKMCARSGRERVRIERDMNRAVLALAILYGLCVVPENARNAVSAYMAARVPPRAAGLLRLASRLLLISRAAATPVLLLCLCEPFGRAFRECCCCCCFRRDSAPRGPGQENDLERTADLELEPTTSTRLQTPANDTTATGSNC